MLSIMTKKILQDLKRERLSSATLCGALGLDFWRFAGQPIVRTADIVECAEKANQPKLSDDSQEYALPNQAVLLLLLPGLGRKRLEIALVRGGHTLAEKPSQVLGELFRSEPLVQCADDLDSSLDLARRLELTQTLIAGRDDFG